MGSYGAVDGGGVSGCGTGVIGALPFLSDPGFRYWWKATAGSLWGEEREGDESTGAAGAHHGITQFQSVCTALAATVGTGNIAGVAAALVSGGPGAVF